MFFIMYPWNWLIFWMRFLRIDHCDRLHTRTAYCTVYSTATHAVVLKINFLKSCTWSKLRWSEWWNICEICYMLRHFVSNIWDLKNSFLGFFIWNIWTFTNKTEKAKPYKFFDSLTTAKWLLDTCLTTT